MGGAVVPTFTRSAAICTALWAVALSWLILGRVDEDPEVYRVLLCMAIASTVVAAIDRHAVQLAEIAALSYRAGTAASQREAKGAED